MAADNKNTKEFNTITYTSLSIDMNTSLLDFKSPKKKPIEEIKLFSFESKKDKKKETQSKININNIIDNKASTSKQVQQEITNYDHAKTVSNMSCDQKDGSINLPNNTKIAYVCPLCFKNCKDDNNRILHMKNCATKNNVSTKKLLQAIKLQNRQTAERVSLGLPSAPVLQNRRQTSVRKLVTNQDSQLQLALALSKSLYEVEEIKNSNQTEQDFIIANINSSVENNTGRIQRKKKQNITSVLQIRSQEERDRLLTEKIAEILVDSETLIQKQQEAKNETETRKKDILRSHVLQKFLNVDNQLWNVAMLQSSQTDFFVKDLSPYVIPNEQKQTYMEDINESNVTKKSQQKGKLAISDESYHDKEENLYTSHRTDGKLFANMKKENIKQSCINNLIVDWGNALNNSSSSDVITFVKGDKHIWVHKLVFHVRCPNILLDIIPNENTVYSVKEKICWNDVEYNIALAFLEFIYCGIIEKYHIFSNDSAAVSSLGYLARKYKVKELFPYIRHTYGIYHDSTSMDNEFEIDEQGAQEICCVNDNQNKFTSTPNRDSNAVKCNNQDIFYTTEVSHNQSLKTNMLSPEKYTISNSLVDRENSMSPDIFDDIDNIKFNHSDNTKFIHIDNSDNNIDDLPSPNQYNFENFTTNQLLSPSLTNESKNSTNESMLVKSIMETPKITKTEEGPYVMTDKVKPKGDLTLFIEEVQKENAISDFEINVEMGSPSKIFIPNNRNPFKKAEYTESNIVLDKFDNTEHSLSKAGKKVSRLSKLESDMQIYAIENPQLCNITIDKSLELTTPTNPNCTDLTSPITEGNISIIDNEKTSKEIMQNVRKNDSITTSYCSSSEMETDDENISMYTKYKRKHIDNSIALYRSAVKKHKNNISKIDKRENNEIILLDHASNFDNITKCVDSDINHTRDDHLNISSLSNICMDEDFSITRMEKNTSNLEFSKKSEKEKEICNTLKDNFSQSTESLELPEFAHWNNDKLVISCDSNSSKTHSPNNGSFNDNCSSTSYLHSFELPDIEKQHSSPPKSSIYSNPIVISSGSDEDSNSIDNNDFNKYDNDLVMSSKTHELDHKLQHFFSIVPSSSNVNIESEIASIPLKSSSLQICRKNKMSRKRTRSEGSLPNNYSLKKDYEICKFDILLRQCNKRNNYKSNANNTLLTVTECYDVSSPNYDIMDTSELHKEMKKYGLKTQNRQKAIKLLTYIYNELHPSISLYETPGINVENSDNENEEPQKKRQKSNTHLSDNIESVVALNECVNIAEAFTKLVNSNKDLHNSILRYESLNLNLLHCMLKTGGFKCNLSALMDFLDEQCITFELPEKPRKIRTKKVHNRSK